VTTSGVNTFNPDIIDLIQDAYEMVGMEVRGGYDMKTARRSLDMLMREWGNRGLNLWTVIREEIPALATGNGAITLPTYVLDVLDAAWRTRPGGELNDQLMTRLSLAQFVGLSNKVQTGTPSQFFVQRMEGDPMRMMLRIWPISTTDGVVAIWGLRSIQDTGDYTNTMDVPPRFLPALVAGLAFQIALKTPKATDRVEMLKMEYDRQWELAAEEDRDRASFIMVPDMSSYNR
jgi:hypothetical protein